MPPWLAAQASLADALAEARLYTPCFDQQIVCMQKLIDIPPVWLCLALCVSWMQNMFIPFGPAPAASVALIGWIAVGAGLGLILAAALAFLQHKTTIIPHQTPARIITSGIFAYGRNPIYLGDALILTGAVLIQGAWISILLVPLFIWWIDAHFIRAEEARMRATFGTDFEVYAQKVRRWV